MKLYSYKVVSDNGYAAPNPSGGICTLAYCKPGLRRSAQPGDYVIGLAGREYRRRAAVHCPIVIYAMKVTHTCSFEEFRTDRQYQEHLSCDINAIEEEGKTDKVLISGDFIYWGGNALLLPRALMDLDIGRAYKCKFPPGVVPAFIQWFEGQQERGCLGTPFDGWYF